VNVVFMPRFSYWASAFGHLASYLTMFIISAILGAKYYPIPYNWKRIGAIFLLLGGGYFLIWWMSGLFSGEGVRWTYMALNTGVIAAYAALCWWGLLRKKF
jgi:hypothetical protein